MRLSLHALLVFCFLSCISAEQEGRVIKVVDGDTFDILHEKITTRVRLFGIDAPERGQAFNKRATAFVDSLVAGRDVRIHIRGKDRYGRTVGDAYLPDGRHVNAEIVRAGYAWQFRQYSNDPEIGRLEAMARTNRRGLWADQHAIPPWEFRRKKK